MRIKNYTAHDVNICWGEYDPSIRKYRMEGNASILFKTNGMLGVKYSEASKPQDTTIEETFVPIPMSAAPKIVSVDPLPEADADTYFIVSVQYLNARKELGMDISHLLTTGNAVVDETGRIVGTTHFVRYDI